MLITVTGENLDSVQEPLMVVHLNNKHYYSVSITMYSLWYKATYIISITVYSLKGASSLQWFISYMGASDLQWLICVFVCRTAR